MPTTSDTEPDVSREVFEASVAVFADLPFAFPYDLERPLGKDGYRFKPAEIKGVAQKILEKTESSTPHPRIDLPASYPLSVKLETVAGLNSDLQKRIRKALKGDSR